jgi:hypothetical protein
LRLLFILTTVAIIVSSLSGCGHNAGKPENQSSQSTVIEPAKGSGSYAELTIEPTNGDYGDTDMVIDPSSVDDGCISTVIEPFDGDDKVVNSKNGGDIEMITFDDLIVVYKGVLINAIRPFADIAADLGIVFDAKDLLSNGTIEHIASKDVDGITYYISNYHYPNIDNVSIIVQYVFNETLQESWLVSISLFDSNILTKRGIKVGDREEDMLKVYGGELEPAYLNGKAYYYYLNPSINFTGISFIVDNDTAQITQIYIDYAHDETFDRLDIIALDGVDIRD